jgi:hypothetical protein
VIEDLLDYVWVNDPKAARPMTRMVPRHNGHRMNIFDPQVAAELDSATWDIASQASAAWEAAVCWDDDYAIKRLAEVRPV